MLTVMRSPATALSGKLMLTGTPPPLLASALLIIGPSAMATLKALGATVSMVRLVVTGVAALPAASV